MESEGLEAWCETLILKIQQWKRKQTGNWLIKGAKSCEGFPRFRKIRKWKAEGSNLGIRIIDKGVRYDYRHRMRRVTYLSSLKKKLKIGIDIEIF